MLRELASSLSFSLFRDDDRLSSVLPSFFGFSLSFQSDAGFVFTSRFREYLCSLPLFTGSPHFLLLSRIMLSPLIFDVICASLHVLGSCILSSSSRF